MTYAEFERGYMAADPNVTAAQVGEAWAYGDMDANKRLSWEEF